jgi:hypothetical protein
MCSANPSAWRKTLPMVLFADRISTKRTTGVSPYEMVFGQRAVLPVDVEAGTFLGVNWEDVHTRAELLEARTEQLLRREEMMDNAYSKMMRVREESVRYWDKKNAHKLRKSPLEVGDMVLVYNASLESQWGKLFENRWNGPYRVKEQLPMGSFVLEELDGTELRRRYAASHVKKFYARGTNEIEESTDEEDSNEQNDGEDFMDDDSRWEESDEEFSV